MSDSGKEFVRRLSEIVGAQAVLTAPEDINPYAVDWRKRYYGKPVAVVTEVTQDPDTGVVTNTKKTLQGQERIKVYKASVAWEDDLFRLDGFYRTGHYHGGSEGDRVGL